MSGYSYIKMCIQECLYNIETVYNIEKLKSNPVSTNKALVNLWYT